MIERPTDDDLLAMIRHELVAQRAVLIHLVDLGTLAGGPDRDNIASQLEALRLTHPDGEADAGAMEHLAGIARMLRGSGRGNVFKMKGWGSEPAGAND